MLDADIKDPRERSRAKAKARFKALIEEAGGALTPDQVTARLQISSERLAEMTEAREILIFEGLGYQPERLLPSVPVR
ncbi:MAG: hypothetical protein HY941_01145 [Gammaproteobacteria bacterium]|nr:hypothetical protein [Gammaproteobacteria bacterium]